MLHGKEHVQGRPGRGFDSGGHLPNLNRTGDIEWRSWEYISQRALAVVPLLSRSNWLCLRLGIRLQIGIFTIGEKARVAA